MGNIKYVIVLLIGIFIILEFCIFPPFSAQIKHDNFIYPQQIEDKIVDIQQSVKTNENVFVGQWMNNIGFIFTFKSDGTGIGIDGDLFTSTERYELNNNILKLKAENNKEWYLIRQ